MSSKELWKPEEGEVHTFDISLEMETCPRCGAVTWVKSDADVTFARKEHTQEECDLRIIKGVTES